ncbi:DUF4175 domain-containing protein [Porphyrobacter sp. ULC335]|uniref:DUF4175 domain-containing protein n=1 Tax=Porphyrobacter sp. ULC335 TaxID=2854260 RepID=UPI00221FA06B|nr:DUF4175 domain-containing protein [Porphyrobacter sp. ULC335]UYV14631.1 DUF4175 domain-containing protein [Porphyrobacter sp. ULC335]
MSSELPFHDWLRPARQRAMADVVLVWSPLVLVLAALGWAWGGVALALGVVVAGSVALAWAARQFAHRFDRDWLVRRLNAREARLEDSAGLLFANTGLAPLERLQADRIATRIAAIDPASLADGWSRRRIAAAWALGAMALAAILYWQAQAAAPPPLAPVSGNASAAPGEPRLTGQRVRIVPPAYTGLAPRYADSLDIRAPMGSRIEWMLAFEPQPASAALQLVGGQSLLLKRSAEGWAGALRLDVPSLYRVTAAGTRGAQPSHRLEPIADEPPQVRVVEPASGLVTMRPGQRSWRVVFEASDDYAVDQLARLTITTAIGEGENVSFSERSQTVTGTGDPRRRRFVIDLPLASYGLSPGSDLVAQITVADTRMPGPQMVRGPGVILRFPAPQPPQAEGLDLMAKQQMPAYFRSQRQVIIDTEALIKQRRNLSADEFMLRSDTIGVDQRLLRLRYGQFVGMEAEETPRPPMPTSDKDSPGEEEEPEHYDGDGHDHGSAPESPVFGDLGNITAEYGHVHDESEAATLLDPDTRALLKAALDAMWEAEVNLRTGKPEAALPFESKALDYIKKIQQATRIYLPRIGSTQPPIDMARRLTGKREGIVGGGAQLAPFAIEDAVPATAWRALAAPGAIDLAGLDQWVRANSARIRDPLAVLAAIDGLRNAPGSRARREALRGQLWTVLARPPAQVRRRDDGGTLGRRYIQGLR